MFGKTHARRLGAPRRPTQRLERLDVRDLHFADEMPAGRLVDLPGRGTAFVRMEEGPAGAPTVLFRGRLNTGINPSFDVTPDGQRFFIAAPVPADASTPVTVVLNWMAALKK